MSRFKPSIKGFDPERDLQRIACNQTPCSVRVAEIARCCAAMAERTAAKKWRPLLFFRHDLQRYSRRQSGARLEKEKPDLMIVIGVKQQQYQIWQESPADSRRLSHRRCVSAREPEKFGTTRR